MPTTDSVLIASLNALIETCRDRDQGFRAAANGVEDEHLRILFNNYCQQRVQLAAELQREVRQLGGTPGSTLSTAGAAERRSLTDKSAVGDQEDAAILIECEQAEDAAIGQYEDLLQTDLPPNVRQVVSRQYAAIKAARDRIRELEKSHAG